MNRLQCLSVDSNYFKQYINISLCASHFRADQDYDMGPATEMMINDFDDERTLDEEEALEGSEDSHNELSNLQKV